jgi:hypothetical protein
MLQHYLVAMGSDEQAGRMIDISRLIHDTFSAKELASHIFDDEGGSSRIMLQRILMPNSVIISSSTDECTEKLKTFGPALVAQFSVHEDFEDRSIHRHHGQPVGEAKGMHCMVLIGCRTDAASGKQFFLLQNWWKSKQFVEVDAEYIEQCGAVLFFVKTPQTCIPDVFPTTTAKYAENESFLDKPEGYAYLEYHVSPPL